MIDWQQLKALRRHIHQHPEVSEKEFATAKTIKDFLSKHAKGTCQNLSETGFMWVLDSGKPGKTVTIRAELDALPIQEINDFSHASKYPGVSHKCGHDGHAVILCGTVMAMQRDFPTSGRYQFLFQPAEENGEGAKVILENKLHHFNSDFVFALHNLPGYPMHHIYYKTGSFTPAVKSIIIKLRGKTAHAAEPEMGINPALAIAEILQKAVALSNNDTAAENFRLVTPIHVNMGEIAYGISAGEGDVRLTLRTWTDAHLELLTDEILQIVATACQAQKLSYTTDFTEVFSANENDEQATNIVQMAAKEAGLEMVHCEAPFKWGEDFGLFTQKFRGAMFGLGAGENTPALHNPDYDFPDELLQSGVTIFTKILKEAIK